jgi:hypothetical protein
VLGRALNIRDKKSTRQKHQYKDESPASKFSMKVKLEQSILGLPRCILYVEHNLRMDHATQIIEVRLR